MNEITSGKGVEVVYDSVGKDTLQVMLVHVYNYSSPFKNYEDQVIFL